MTSPWEGIDVMAIDPAVRALHCAWFTSGILTRAKSIRVTDEKLLVSKDLFDVGHSLASIVCLEFGRPHWLIIEGQRYRQFGEGNPQDIVDLAQVAGCATAIASRVRSFWPETWKGQIEKSVHHARVTQFFESQTTTGELDIWTKQAKNKDLRDAVALGLFGLGRVGRGAEKCS